MKQSLKIIKSLDDYNKEPQATKDILFSYGWHLMEVTEKKRGMYLAPLVILLLLGMQLLITNTKVQKGDVELALAALSFFLIVTLGAFLYWSYGFFVALWRKEKAIRFIAETLGIDARGFDLDKLKKNTTEKQPE